MDGVAETVVGNRPPNPTGIINDPIPRQLVILAHLAEEAADRAVRFLLGLTDEALNDHLVENLPDRLGVVA